MQEGRRVHSLLSLIPLLPRRGAPYTQASLHLLQGRAGRPSVAARSAIVRIPEELLHVGRCPMNIPKAGENGSLESLATVNSGQKK